MSIENHLSIGVAEACGILPPTQPQCCQGLRAGLEPEAASSHSVPDTEETEYNISTFSFGFRINVTKHQIVF